MTPSSEPRAPWLVLRWVVGLQFVAAASFSALNWPATVEFNALLTGAQLAPVATALQIAFALVGGLSIATDFHPRAGALLLFAFLVAASARHLVAAREAVHLVELAGATGSDVVSQLGALARRGQMASLAKNIGLIGVVLFIAMRAAPTPAKDLDLR